MAAGAGGGLLVRPLAVEVEGIDDGRPVHHRIGRRGRRGGRRAGGHDRGGRSPRAGVDQVRDERAGQRGHHGEACGQSGEATTTSARRRVAVRHVPGGLGGSPHVGEHRRAARCPGPAGEEQIEELLGGRPLDRVLGQRQRDHAGQRLRQAVEDRRRGEDAGGGRHRDVTGERCAAGARVRHHRTPREDVGRRGDVPVGGRVEALGRHVRQGADHLLGARVMAGRLQRPGDAEVDHLGDPEGEQYVARLEIAVDHPGAVDGGQRGRHPDRHAVQAAPGQRALLLDHLRQAGAVDVFDHQIGRVVVGVGVEHLGGAERRHLAGPVDLAAEPGPETLVGRELGPDHLDRDRSPVGIASQVDRAHAALADPGHHPVATEDARVGGKQRARHGEPTLDD